MKKKSTAEMVLDAFLRNPEERLRDPRYRARLEFQKIVGLWRDKHGPRIPRG